jgi:hypothetical protein
MAMVIAPWADGQSLRRRDDADLDRCRLPGFAQAVGDVVEGLQFGLGLRADLAAELPDQPSPLLSLLPSPNKGGKIAGDQCRGEPAQAGCNLLLERLNRRLRLSSLTPTRWWTHLPPPS